MSSQIFRRQDGDEPLQHHNPFLVGLADEWDALNASRSTLTTISRWAEQHPLMAQFTNPRQLLDYIDTSEHDAKDALLRMLLELFQDGSQIAGRILLQAMLPKLKKLATKHVFGADDFWTEDRLQTTISEFWYVIAHYPSDRRPVAIANGLSLDTLRRVRYGTGSGRIRTIDEVPMPGPDLDPLLDRGVYVAFDCRTAPIELHPNLGIEQVAAWAVANEILSASECAFMLAVLSAGGGQSGRKAVELTGLSHAAARQKFSRIRRRLTAAASASWNQSLATV